MLFASVYPAIPQAKYAPFAYDWRLDIRHNALRLLDELAQRAEPVNLLTHSQGGLIAIAASLLCRDANEWLNLGGPMRNGRDIWEGASTVVVVAAAVIVVGSVAACADSAERPGKQADQIEAMDPITFRGGLGWRDLADSGRILTDVERRASGGVIGRAVDIALDQNDRLYVLDAAFMKIAIFSPDGDLEGVIHPGHGQGPGELMRPSALSLTRDGSLFVYDGAQARVSEYSMDGTYVSTYVVPFANVYGFLATDSSFWFLRWSRVKPEPDPVVVRVSRHSRVETGRYVIPTPHEANIIEHGETGRLAPLLEGEGVLYASPTPLVVYRIDAAGNIQRFGRSLFPDAFGYRRPMGPEGVLVSGSPLGIRGLTQLQDGRIAVLARVPAQSEPHTTEMYFGMLDRGGDVIHWAPVDSTRRPTRMLAHRTGTHAFFLANDDVPPILIADLSRSRN